MTKVYKLQDLDCANCAAKMEKGASKVSGVKEVRFNFLTQKMTLEVEDDKDIEKIVAEIQKVCAKIEPDCKIITK